MATNNTIKIGYWGFKGLGEYPKLIAAFVGTPIEEVSEGATWKTEVKNSIGLDFPNLPYLIDGDVKIAESSAIPVYLALKAGKPELLGVGPIGQARVRQIEGVLGDIKKEFYKIFFGTEDKSTLPALFTALVKEGKVVDKLALLSTFLGENKFFTGDQVTLVDIEFANVANSLGASLVDFGLVNPFFVGENLKALTTRVYELPGIKERVTSAAWVAKPWFPKFG